MHGVPIAGGRLIGNTDTIDILCCNQVGARLFEVLVIDVVVYADATKEEAVLSAAKFDLDVLRQLQWRLCDIALVVVEVAVIEVQRCHARRVCQSFRRKILRPVQALTALKLCCAQVRIQC